MLRGINMTGEYYAIKEDGSWRAIGDPSEIMEDETLSTVMPPSTDGS